MSKIERFVLGPFQTNTYLLILKGKKGVIIDPSWPYGIERVYKRIRFYDLDVQYILLTHGHFDHFLGGKKLIELLEKDIRLRIHPDDYPILKQSGEMAKRLFGLDLGDIDLNLFMPLDKNKITVDETIIEVIHTPGHTPGSVCYYVPRENIAFTGDTLFKDSVGRTDLPGGSFDMLLDSLYKITMKLKPNTKIFPGHGESTTLDRELLENSFLSLAVGRKRDR